VTGLALGMRLIGKDMAIVFEASVSGRFGKSVERHELAGTCKYIFNAVMGFDCFFVMPRALKSFMGHGGAKKSDMKKFARENFGVNLGNNNITDAYCLARYFVAYDNGADLPILKCPALKGFSYLQVPAKFAGLIPKSFVDKKSAKL
jgi:hypothetical protein